MKIEWRVSSDYLSEINFSIGVILEINQCKKLVERYKTNLNSSGNRKLRLPVSNKK
jgi:hypothetical protein